MALNDRVAATYTAFSVILVYAALYHALLLLAPLQLEAREGAPLLQVHGALSGVSIYGPQNLPVYLNNYGSVYISVGSLFSKILGRNYLALRLISALSIACSLALLNDILKRRRVVGWLRFPLCVSCYVGLLSVTTPLARPDALGFLTLMVAFWIFEVYSTNILGACCSILIAVVGLLIKQYFVLIGPYIISYIFFYRSKRLGLILAACFALVMAAAYRIDTYMLPGYLPMILAINSGETSPVTLHSTVFMLKQSAQSFLVLAPAIYACWLYSTPETVNWRERFKRPSFAGYASLLSLLVLTLKFGHHDGQRIVYYVHLLLPFLIVWMAPEGKLHPRNAMLASPGTLLATYAMLALLAIRESEISPRRVVQTEHDMQEIYKDMEPYKHVLGSTWVVSIEVKQGKTVYNSGQSYMMFGGAEKKAWRLPGLKLAPEDFTRIHEALIKNISHEISVSGYDLIVTDDVDSLTPEEQRLIRSHYRLLATRPLGSLIESEWIPIARMPIAQPGV